MRELTEEQIKEMSGGGAEIKYARTTHNNTKKVYIEALNGCVITSVSFANSSYSRYYRLSKVNNRLYHLSSISSSNPERKNIKIKIIVKDKKNVKHTVTDTVIVKK